MARVSIVPSTTLIANSRIQIYFLWDENVTGFTASDITVSAGTKGTLTGSNSTYRLDYIPPNTGSGNVTITVRSNAVTQRNTVTTGQIAYGRSITQPNLLANNVIGVSIAQTANWIYTLGLQPYDPGSTERYSALRRYSRTANLSGVSTRQQLASYFDNAPHIQSIAILNNRFLFDDVRPNARNPLQLNYGLIRTTETVSDTDAITPPADPRTGLGDFTLENNLAANVTLNPDSINPDRIYDIAVSGNNIFVLYHDRSTPFALPTDIEEEQGPTTASQRITSNRPSSAGIPAAPRARPTTTQIVRQEDPRITAQTTIFATQRVLIFNLNGSFSSSFTIETDIFQSEGYAISARAITATNDRIYIGFDLYASSQMNPSGRYGDANKLWAYSLTGERIDNDDIDLPVTFRGNENAFGILSLDYDSDNNQLWALVHQKDSPSIIDPAEGDRRLATITLAQQFDTVWTYIPKQTMNIGDKFDLNAFAAHADHIVFAEGYSAVPWLTLGNGIISIASTGVPAGKTDMIIPLVAIGRGNPSFITLNISVIAPAPPIWDTIPLLIREETETIDLNNYVSNATTITGTALPLGITISDGILTIPNASLTKDQTVTIAVTATNSNGNSNTSFQLTVLNQANALLPVSYRGHTILWEVEIAGYDISDDVISVNNIAYELDLTVTGAFTVSECTLELSNDNNVYQAGGAFYDKLAGQSPYQVPVIVRIGFRAEEDIFRRIFTGVILSISEIKESRDIRIVCIDQSAVLRDSLVENFGITKSDVRLNDGRQTYQGEYDIPLALSPISDNSLSGTSGGRALNIQRDNQLNLVGNLNARNAKQTDNGLLTEGSLLQDNPIVEFKTSYSYIDQTALLSDLLRHFNIHNIVADKILTSDATANDNIFQSLGRVGFNIEPTAIIRYAKDMIANSATNKLYVLSGSPYIGAADYLYEYDRNRDTWRIVIYFSPSDEVWQIATEDYNIFYAMATSKRADINVLPNATYDSSEATSGNPSKVKILKATIDEQKVESFISNTSTYPPQLATFYSVGFPRENASSSRYGKLPDNRSGFEVKGGRLYYRYATATTFGIARVTSSGSPRQFMTPMLAPDNYGNATSFAFCLSDTECFLGYSTSTGFAIIKRNLTSGSATPTVISLTNKTSGADRYALTGALEMFATGTDLYAIVQRHPTDNSNNRIEDNNASAALYHINTANNTATLIREYAYCQLAARSFTLHDNSVYCFEGSHYAYKFDVLQPRESGTPITDPRILLDNNEWKDTIGNLQRINGTSIRSIGRVWRSALDNPGDFTDSYYGIHGGTASPMVSMNKELFIVPGYSNYDAIGLDDSAINSIDNLPLISYGTNISKRIPRIETNNKTGYEVLQEIATTADAFFGIENNRFFFKDRREPITTINAALSETATTITATDTTAFANTGYLLIASEILSYSGKTPTTFTGVKRSVPPSNASSHTIGVNIVGINHLLASSGVKAPITSWVATDDIINLYNVIIVDYDDIIYTVSDEDSINRYGRRELDISTLHYFAQPHIVQAVANEYLATFKDLQQRIVIDLELSLYLNIGDIVLIVGEQHNALIRIYELNHEFSTQQTTIVGRTITEAVIQTVGGSRWGEFIWSVHRWGGSPTGTAGAWDRDTWDGTFIWGA